jgi:hypothetical protein
MPPREPPESPRPAGPDNPLTPQQKSQVLGFLSRLFLLLPLGLALWATALAFDAAGPAKLLPLSIGFVAVMIVGAGRPLTGGVLVMASAFVEWWIGQAWPGVWPLPSPLGALLVPTLVLIVMEFRSPQPVVGDILDRMNSGPAHLLKLLVLALPVMMVVFFGAHRAG